ncbi:Tyrosine-protein kinase [Parasponia andersonii]|uniref:Tyrosine-protein kinase n=1 Tax=Parasponia andersonii TaxID=3476 RepID=A0A2P5CZ13_PARAD|nr:Tyrosine-protein kinase [Parasponia andersonii]
MVNGSLEEWLHGSHVLNLERGQIYLNFVQRIEICIDVANAVDYLHNNSHLPIIHCDLKPSKILFDGDMTACAGNFGKRPTDIMFKDERNIRKFTTEALPERGEQIVDPVLLEREYNSTNKRNQSQTQRMRQCLTSILRIGLACCLFHRAATRANEYQ